ncbi:hypothetical protein [Sphaerisporangium corydalis]|nr:hypothetical protein [Sphaerisporangium corydalis]
MSIRHRIRHEGVTARREPGLAMVFWIFLMADVAMEVNRRLDSV